MTSPSTSIDQICKQVRLQSSLPRVWRALSDSAEFGAWFGMRIDGLFEVGSKLAAVSTSQECSGMGFDLWIERIDPETDFAFRWKPSTSEPGRDVSHDPTTLVHFQLKAIDGGTELTVTESGFDAFPEDLRTLFFQRNEGGWAFQIEAIRKYCDDA
jgi:uncharacterized protein YndB with AHSA1/START domain